MTVTTIYHLCPPSRVCVCAGGGGAGVLASPARHSHISASWPESAADTAPSHFTQTAALTDTTLSINTI